MKHILSLIAAVLLLASQAYADTVTADALRQAGMPNEQAVLVSGVLNGAGYVSVTDHSIVFAGALATSNTISTGSNGTTDSNSLNLTGGPLVGGVVPTNGATGATLFLRGNEFTSTGGSISAILGNAATANLNLIMEHASSNVIIKDLTTGNLWSFTDTGVFLQDPTNALDIVMGKAATGLVVGEAARAATVTTATTLNVPLYLSAAGAGTDLAAFVSSGASTSGANVDFFKTRAASGAATTIVVSGDTIGGLKFLGANGTTYDTAAQIRATVGGTPGATTDMPGSLIFETSPDGSVTPAAVLTLGAAKTALFTGTVTSSATSDLGWSIAVGLTNATCNTQCTSACVTGMDTDGAKTVFVACNAATAENCLCAGAS